MRLLANENFPADAVQALREAGYDLIWIHEDAPGITDAEVLMRAIAENRVLLTFDKDFGELAYRVGLPVTCGIILLRIPMPSSAYIAKVAQQHLVAGMTGQDTSRLLNNTISGCEFCQKAKSKSVVTCTMLKQLFIRLIRFYQWYSHKQHRVCRYKPSCSAYMILSVEKYGLLVGIWKGLKRLVRCRPPYGGIDYP